MDPPYCSIIYTIVSESVVLFFGSSHGSGLEDFTMPEKFRWVSDHVSGTCGY